MQEGGSTTTTTATFSFIFLTVIRISQAKGIQMTTCHVRSISLPSQSHPITLSIEEQLSKSKNSQSPLSHKMSGLKGLYECIDNLLQLPHAQQSLSCERESDCVEVSNGSLRLLDICNTARDILSQTKENLKGLESSLRRRRCKGSGMTDEIDAYMAARKKLNKEICKCLRNLRRKEKNLATSSSEEVNILRSAEKNSLAVFEDILFFISQQKSKTKPSGWSIVSKLKQSKRVSCESNVQVSSETEKMDAELLVLKSSKQNDRAQVKNVLKGLEAYESSIRETEEELECVYRRMVKARVSLLNILNH